MNVRGVFQRAALGLGLSLGPALGAQTNGTAAVRHAPTLNGRIEGSVQVMTAEAVTLNGNAVVTGDLLVPGTPTVRLNGSPSYGGTVDGNGAAAPNDYQVTLNGNATLRHVVRRTNPISLPAVEVPPLPGGTRSVALNQPGQGPGDFATLKNLTLNGNAGAVAVPPGTYGTFTANSGTGFVLGVAGATTPAAYNLQSLALNSGSRLDVVGPVVLTLNGSFVANSGACVGAEVHPEWLGLRIAGGGLTANGGASVCARLEAPAGTVTLNGTSRLIGALVADRLIVNGNSLLRVTPANLPPAVSLDSPADGAGFFAPAAITLQATASDPDGTIAKVEFFQGTTKLGEVANPPYELAWTAVPEGSYTLTAAATDDDGALTISAPVGITVATPVNQPPTVTLTSPLDGANFTTPATIHLEAMAADADGTVAKVEFFQGAAKLGEATVAPFALDWLDVAPGGYTLTAKATDDDGATATSVPATISVATGMPFAADFEQSEGYMPGSLDGQGGWISDGASLVTNADAQHGEQSVLLPPRVPPVGVSHGFPDSVAEAVIFVDFHALAVAGNDPTAGSRYETDSAQVALVRSGDRGVLQVFDGDGAGGGTWKPTLGSIPVDAGGVATDWHRLTLRSDYSTKKWDLYLDGAMVAADAGFRDNARSTFGSFAAYGDAVAPTLLDHFLASFDNPLFADTDKDGISDAWELAHGLDPTVNDRNADPDLDGSTNVQEFLHGTDPQDYYNGAVPVITALVGGDGHPGPQGLVSVSLTRASDGAPLRGAPVSFAVTGTAILISANADDSDPVSALDLRADAQGIARIYVAFNGSAGDVVVVTARSGSQTATLSLPLSPPNPDSDGNGIPDAWELAHFGHIGIDPNADPDGDGLTNLQEYQLGTDPNDFYNGVVPEVVAANGGGPGPNNELTMTVRKPDGTPWPNAPVTFEITSGGRRISAVPGGPDYSTRVEARTDANGVATVYLEPYQP